MISMALKYSSQSFRCMARTTREQLERIGGANPVVIFSRSSCCLCHVVKRLFSGMGVHYAVYDLDEYPRLGNDVEKALGGDVPLVFIGGELVGGIATVIASHINGTLVPLLKQAGALWL